MHLCFAFCFFHLAALSIVKEVANHANDIMKQGVRISFLGSYCFVLSLSSPLLHDAVFQDNFQKLMHIQYSLNGHHEIVQPGRVSRCLKLSSWGF